MPDVDDLEPVQVPGRTAAGFAPLDDALCGEAALCEYWHVPVVLYVWMFELCKAADEVDRVLHDWAATESETSQALARRERALRRWRELR